MNDSIPPDSVHANSSDKGEPRSDAGLLRDYDILRLRAPNPGPLTLTGTNTWVVGRRPAWVVDPGPLIDTHIKRVLAAIDARGGLGGVALTHDHADHSEAVEALLEAHPAPLAAGGRRDATVKLADDVRFGPFQAVYTPGHAPDHYALIGDGACFTGDAVLGDGSVLITPHPRAMAGYLLALTRLRLREDFNVLCPGHGEVVWDAREKLEEYIAHRVDRENRLIVALNEGLRSVADLLDAVWGEVPEELHPAATATLAAHLDKLEDDEVLPRGVERPNFQNRPW
ncbi:MAG TPA: MBL fold metallo-hydrolase [Solirubrobacteraceae bacterium]|jgi:glyoxylase-like metal-dependent hydrolase (beta-lactamase superfamily II)